MPDDMNTSTISQRTILFIVFTAVFSLVVAAPVSAQIVYLSTHAIVFITSEDANLDGQTPDTISFNYDPPLLLPGDGSASVLRIRTEQAISGFGQESTTTIYSFLTEDNNLAASIIVASDGSTTASYQVLESQTSGSSSERPDQLPQRLTLGQNYPNPFSGNTTIDFALPKAGSVELTVYDLLGRRVATLANRQKPAGERRVSFHAGKLAGGCTSIVFKPAI